MRPMEAGDRTAVLALASSLTDFFPHEVMGLIEVSLDEHPVLVGTLGKEIVGFVSFAVRERSTAEILWMGVNEDYHGLGLGTVLFDAMERALQGQGVKKIVVSTLSYTVEYKPWEKVRSFFYHRGFRSLGIEANHYGEGVDRLILTKNIR